MVHLSAQHMLGITCLSLPVLARAVSAHPPAAASPSADTELICSLENSTDCYPRLFQPTKDFQVIKQGQDLPPGLHVRMDMTTGSKEARLNIPMEGETSEDVIEVPMEQAMVVVPQPDEDAPVDKKPKIPEKAPVYEAAGKVQPPRSSGGSDSEDFRDSLQVIKTGKGDLLPALDQLSELAHDIYYGSELAKDEVLFEKLACLMTDSNQEASSHKAASVIGSAMQNNPTALAEVSKFWEQILYPTCDGTKQDLISRLESSHSVFKDSGSDAATMKAQTRALSGLLREPSIRNEFLSTKGMELLLRVFIEEGSQWNNVRVKIAQLIMDNFLDETMGAELGLWPTQPLLENKVCERSERTLEDGCWDYHVSKFEGGGWSKDFSAALKEQRKINADSVKDREL
ncbi:nucleotide exchange factor sil1 [Phlyctema vagabunda]|uniref:Nucleotide exchange factor SIL1 n=1 Tax=Phlyctema vagabunda TaxID=108571 RepID=A0ABR4P2N9_9HELO